MKISVIIPTYKPEGYIWDCLKSLKNQTFPFDEFEIIIVLNGCLEPYKTQIQSYIYSQMPNNVVHLIQTDEPGVSNARNIGIEASIGEYITFLDSDDYVSSSYLSMLYSRASKSTISLCYPLAFKDGESTFYEYYITNEYNRRAQFGKQSYVSAKSYFSGPVYKLIHRDIIADARFNNKFRNGEDSIFMFQISKRFKYVSFTDKDAVYFRRVRAGSATNNPVYKKNIINNRMSMIKEYTRIYLGDIFHYNLGFYLTRIGASIKVIIKNYI